VENKQPIVTQRQLDEKFMREAIKLADKAGQTGDLPFGSIVVSVTGEVIGAGYNLLQQNKEIDAHAERLALRQAQKRMNSRTLRGCTVYTTVEPCPMCSFPMRELFIARVVWGLSSPVMGGFSKYKVLQDWELSAKAPTFFGQPPETLGGVLRDEAAESWKKYAPEFWRLNQEGGILV
jgi:tRNA(adenine34) deaminase